jgi:hypothetical protein
MDDEVRELIRAVHDSGWRLVLAATGGGAGLAAWLLAVPGGSRSVLEVVVPYAEESLGLFLGRQPASFCSTETSRLMARRALERARWLRTGEPVLGLACTASLRSDRPKRGPHRCHLSVCQPGRAETWSLTLTKEARDREQEEEVVDRLLLNLLARACGVNRQVAVPLKEGETVETEVLDTADPLTRFLRGAGTGSGGALLVDIDGQMRADGPRPELLLPGSFNPLHEGHLELAEVASRLAGVPAAFELSVVNADKPPLAEEEVRHRLVPFAWRAPLWLTRAPTFEEKARLFPGAVFVVGADTAARIVQSRFYENSEARMRQALAKLRAAGCRFLVAGRVDREGRFVGLAELALPAEFADLFEAIPAELFRLDVSSTALRCRNP